VNLSAGFLFFSPPLVLRKCSRYNPLSVPFLSSVVPRLCKNSDVPANYKYLFFTSPGVVVVLTYIRSIPFLPPCVRVENRFCFGAPPHDRVPSHPTYSLAFSSFPSLRSRCSKLSFPYGQPCNLFLPPNPVADITLEHFLILLFLFINFATSSTFDVLERNLCGSQEVAFFP